MRMGASYAVNERGRNLILPGTFNWSSSGAPSWERQGWVFEAYGDVTYPKPLRGGEFFEIS